LNRAVAVAVMFSIVGPAIPVSAGTSANPMSLREVLETRREANTDVIIELSSGSHVLGAIGRMKKATFYICWSAATTDVPDHFGRCGGCHLHLGARCDVG
jgi:hypothetical protein